ncbi:hypothetical protein EVAR_28435_1 [Eumeta japonica]|uniref:Uncharacterized protein n=1 Tax=Eumeta variegata TaxID=151549 RepID=A0A4C1V8V2_EUMVA|nr:hypothetical protein EVAR_28435_1 [Eumeta japonica]
MTASGGRRSVARVSALDTESAGFDSGRHFKCRPISRAVARRVVAAVTTATGRYRPIGSDTPLPTPPRCYRPSLANGEECSTNYTDARRTVGRMSRRRARR